jgi:hypothetical protein
VNSGLRADSQRCHRFWACREQFHAPLLTATTRTGFKPGYWWLMCN